jgi:transcriptional regulator with XRE-family HTH domain
MQAFFPISFYGEDMAKTVSRLKVFREAAGLSQRELARQIDQDQSNVRYWETSGNLSRSDVLLPMAKALGVTVEELLGESRPKRVVSPGGRSRQLFEAVSKMPRRQQEKILDILEPFVRQHANGNT